ncbi:MAG: replicative DNA helicase, partial [Bdellovibrionota bacterium]
MHPSNPLEDLQAERSILGTLLLDGAALSEAIGLGLNPESFSIERHQLIFQMMLELERSGTPVDLVTLTSRLSQTRQLQASGGTEVLTSLFDDAFRPKNLSSYVQTVLQNSQLRRLSETCLEIHSQIQTGVPEIADFVNQAEARVFEATQAGQAGKGLQSVSEVLPEFIAEIERRSASGSDVVGLKTGFPAVDRLTNGLRPHQVWVIAARPGMGKTSFVLSIVQNIGIRSDGVVGFFSMEMKGTELLERMISGLTQIDGKRLRLGQLRDMEWQKLIQAADQIARAKVFIDESGGVTVLDIRSRCRRLKHREKRLDLVVIDYLQLISPIQTRNAGTPESDLATISRNLKELAKELNVPIIVLSQLNRMTVNSGNSDKRPTLGHLRGSGAIEQDADMVAFIHREEA